MIRTDSRKVEKGDTFVALPGISSSGSDYIEEAIARGAVCIVCTDGEYEVQTVHAVDTRKYLEEALVREYGQTVADMKLIGVTGTNGKTTTCYLLWQAFSHLGIRCAYIGTIGFYLEDKVRDLPNTSIDICDFYELLLEAHGRGFDHVVLEASSQGLDMGRLHTIAFDAAVFTNLTEDHLDYHGSMHAYALAKKKLFDALEEDGTAIVNADDEAKSYFIRNDRKLLTYGRKLIVNSAEKYCTSEAGNDAVSDVEICECAIEDMSGSEVNLAVCGRDYQVTTNLIGEYNMYNLAAAFAAAIAMGVEADRFVKVIPLLKAPEGRMDRIEYKGGSIIIDYAHTPDAFEKIFASARSMARGDLYAVFGCTGDREREKRPLMTRIALENSAECILTVDDIHSEDPERIFADMTAGQEKDNYQICTDRKEAIRTGMELMHEGDILLILGKGHEQFIAADSGNIPHNDRQAVLEIIAEEI